MTLLIWTYCKNGTKEEDQEKDRQRNKEKRKNKELIMLIRQSVID